MTKEEMERRASEALALADGVARAPQGMNAEAVLAWASLQQAAAMWTMAAKEPPPAYAPKPVGFVPPQKAKRG